jgi:hypothetical protein
MKIARRDDVTPEENDAQDKKARGLIKTRLLAAREGLRNGDDKRFRLNAMLAHEAFTREAKDYAGGAHANSVAGARSGGRKGGGKNQKVSTGEIIAAADKLRAGNASERDIAGILAGKFSVTKTTIRKHTKKSETKGGLVSFRSK